MVNTLALALCLVPQRQESLPLPSELQAGWADELEDGSHWAPISAQNPAVNLSLKKGEVMLALGKVPADWPYAYQWSGVTRDAKNEISQFPVLLARTTLVKGYAHLDVDVISDGMIVKGLRSSTITAAGMVLVDVGKELPVGKYEFRIRMIVGGPKEGCAAVYDWVRFVRRGDVEFLTRYPGYRNMKGGKNQ